MRICYSKEAREKLAGLRTLDRDIGEALSASIEMLAADANEFDGVDGYSIRRIQGLFRRGVRVYRLKYPNFLHDLRVLFFSIASKNCVFITGIHHRGELGIGADYNFGREPLMRAQRYWTFREQLCLT
jgi:hypothetical protein